jgi:hypothetical protein
MLFKELVKVDTILEAGQAEGLTALLRLALQPGERRFGAFSASAHWVEIAGRYHPLAKLHLDLL